MLTVVLLLLSLAVTPSHAGEWRLLAAGMELRSLEAKSPGAVGDSKIIVVRVDPVLWELDLVGRTMRCLQQLY